jgi:hypothetical protein
VEIGALDTGFRSPHDGAFELPRSARLDQLSAERTKESLRHCRQAQFAHALELRGRFADERITREATQKLGVVSIDGEDEPQPLEALFGFRA